jgi:formate hydrogenlyase subunit 3/multisubunit Na+/H+ antiporter MnhD subunit
LPDAHAEGPTPISAVLSGLLLNVALYAILRVKVLADGALHNGLPGQLLIGFGLLSVLVAAFSLSRQKDVKRMFSYSSIEHIGLATFAFGIGGPIATYAGLLHMTVHSLVKSAIFFAVGHACQKAGTQVIADIRGLITVSPTVGCGLLIGALAILGMPPFGVFASEFLIMTTAMRELPWAAPILVLALAVAFGSIFARVQSMVFGETTAKPLIHRPALTPVFLHLGLALLLGLYIPPYLDLWFRQAVHMIVG